MLDANDTLSDRLVEEALRYLEPDEQDKALGILKKLKAREERAPSILPKGMNLQKFVSHHNRKYRWYAHCKALSNVLERVAKKEIRRLMIFMPPRHGKTELTSKEFAAYYLAKHPDEKIVLSSYSAKLAESNSRAVRANFQSVGGVLKGDTKAVDDWQTAQGGSVRAVGVGGSLTGFGFNLGIIDDPFKDAKEANSEVQRENVKEWWRSVFYTREEDEGIIIVINTRWNEDDLTGWLLQQENEDEPERWHVVVMPAIKEDYDYEVPETCTVEPDFRAPGEALLPERFPVERLRRIKKRVGSYWWSALFQQKPSPTEGGMFKRDWWKFWAPAEMIAQGKTVMPDCVAIPSEMDWIGQSWDMNFKDEEAAKSGNPDYVVGVCAGVSGARLFLLDLVRGQFDFPSTLVAVSTFATKWPEAAAKFIEDKANGTGIIATLKKKIFGIVAVDPSGGKVARANGYSVYCEAGNVFLPDPSIAPWVHDFIEEHAQFPTGKFDDQVDATSQLIIRVQGMLKEVEDEDLGIVEEDRAWKFNRQRGQFVEPKHAQDLLEGSTTRSRLPRFVKPALRMGKRGNHNPFED